MDVLLIIISIERIFKPFLFILIYTLKVVQRGVSRLLRSNFVQVNLVFVFRKVPCTENSTNFKQMSFFLSFAFLITIFLSIETTLRFMSITSLSVKHPLFICRGKCGQCPLLCQWYELWKRILSEFYWGNISGRQDSGSKVVPVQRKRVERLSSIKVIPNRVHLI